MSQRAVRGGRWAGRAIGVILIGTGLGKALDVPGFVEVVATYRLLPAWGNVLVGYALPPLELAIGLAKGRLVSRSLPPRGGSIFNTSVPRSANTLPHNAPDAPGSSRSR